MLSSFLLVLALIESVSASSAICAGVKCRLERGTRRYRIARRPWGEEYNVDAWATTSAASDFPLSLVSLVEIGE